jgi:hypothetical protein
VLTSAGLWRSSEEEKFYEGDLDRFFSNSFLLILDAGV